MHTSFVAVLDNIRSLYNVGSMFRTADAFGVEHLYLCGLTGRPDDELTRERLHKTALGAEDSVPWSYTVDTTDAIMQLKTNGYTILALEQTPTAVSLFDCDRDGDTSEVAAGLFRSERGATNRVALVVGHELYGVAAPVLTLADQHLMIPMLGAKESLNVSVAFGIAASWLRSQKSCTPGETPLGC